MKSIVIVGLLAIAGCTAPIAEDCGPMFDGRYDVVSGDIGDVVEVRTSPVYWESSSATFAPVYGPGCATMTGDVVQRGEVVGRYDLERTETGLVGVIERRGDAVRVELLRSP